MNNGGIWPTSWGPSPFATHLSRPVQQTTKNAPPVIGESGPNIFPDPAVGRESFEFTLVGSSGSRNSLRGDGMFIINTGVGKRFIMRPPRDAAALAPAPHQAFGHSLTQTGEGVFKFDRSLNFAASM